MSGNTLFEGRGSNRGTVTYQTYDERSVSRDEIERALRKASISAWFSKPLVLSALTLVLAVAMALITWWIKSLTGSHTWPSGGSTMHTLVHAVVGAALFHGLTLTFLLIIAVPLLILIGVIWYVSRM